MTDELRKLVTVKPLEWGPVEAWKKCSKERAEAFGGEYQVVILDPPDGPPSLYFELGLGALQFRFELEEDPDWPGSRRPKQFASIADVKAAAQADYEARIFAAMPPTPHPTPADGGTGANK